MATIRGNNRNNALNGTDAADVMFGLGGGDRVAGGAGQDVLYGDDDSLTDTFGAGNDRLDGGADRDLLIGGAGNDALIGGDGDDILIGGLRPGPTRSDTSSPASTRGTIPLTAATVSTSRS